MFSLDVNDDNGGIDIAFVLNPDQYAGIFCNFRNTVRRLKRMKNLERSMSWRSLVCGVRNGMLFGRVTNPLSTRWAIMLS
jgi:hypothetical protein